jgi:acetyl esterase
MDSEKLTDTKAESAADSTTTATTTTTTTMAAATVESPPQLPQQDPPMNVGAPSSAPLMEREEPNKQAKEIYSSPLPPCWFCRVSYCCFGGKSKDSNPKFAVRAADCCALLLFHSNGAYVGGKFNRKSLESQVGARVPCGLDKKSGVTSQDISMPSSYVKDLVIPIRMFSPPASTNKSKKPIMIYFHGGGFVLGHPYDQSCHMTCLKFAQIGGMYVLSVDYRLAPENKFPAAVEDAFDVVRWICSTKPANILPNDADFSDILLCGESSGGGLATVVATLARDGLGPDLKPCEDTKTMKFSHLILAYPSIFMEAESAIPFYSPFAHKPIIDFFYNAYLKNSSGDRSLEEIIRLDRRVRPIISGFQDLPPTVMITGGLDPFRPGNDLAIAEFRQAGVTVQHHHYESETHGFLGIGVLTKNADPCIRTIVEDINKQRNLAYVGRKFGLNSAKGAVGKVIRIRDEDQIAELDLGWGKAYCPIDNLIIVASEAERKRRGSLVI